MTVLSGYLIRLKTVFALAMTIVLLPITVAHAEPPLWTAKIGTTDVALFGSVHFLDPDLDWEPEALTRAIARADRIVFEIPDDHDAQIEIITAMAREGYNPPGERLSSQFSDADWESIERAARLVGIPMRELERSRPWLATIMISTQFIVSQGLDPSAGVDAVMAQRARELGKALDALETPTDQITLFSSLPPDVQRAMLLQTVTEIDETGDYIDAINRAWIAGDTEELSALLHGPMEGFEEVREAVLIARNRNWANIMEAWADRPGHVLMIVGVGHLVGPDNLLDMLRARGFEVTGP